MKNKSKKLLVEIAFILAFIIMSNFNIAKAADYVPNISTCMPKVNGIHEYAGQQIKPEVGFNRNLTEGTDYIVEYKSTDLKNPGTKKLIVKGIHNYYGEVELTYVIKPAPMRDVTITNVTESTITIGWKVWENGADKYLVGIKDENKNTWKQIEPVKNECTLNNLEGGKTYTIGVVPAYYEKEEKKDYEGNYSFATTITTPNRVKNLKTSIINTTQTRITWNGNKEAKYKVYYLNEGESNWVEAGETEEEYFDINTTDLKGEYKVKVIAYVTRDGQNVDSQEAIFSNSMLPKAPVQGPTILLNDGIQIKWTSSENVKGYVIYRISTIDTAYRKIATVGGSIRTYTDKNVVTGRIYQYKIVAFNEVTGSTYYGKYSNVRSRLMIVRPSKLSVTTYPTSAKITWSKVTNAKGYKIYRAKSTKGPYYLIKTVKGNSIFSYTDKNLSRYKNYYYKVRTYYINNSKTYYSNYTGYAAKYPLAKVNLKSATYSSKKYNKLTWSKVKYANGYQVWRSTSKNGTYKKVATVKGNAKVSYKDKKITPGVTYYYKVRAYKGDLRGQYSVIKTRTTGTVAQQLNRIKLKTKSTGDKKIDAILNKMVKRAITREGMSNYEKAKALYAYVQKNLNTKDGFSSNHFAGTYCELLRYIGINANCIYGKFKTKSGWSGHLWVEYSINGTTYICDVNIDNSYMKKNKGKVQYQLFLKKKSSLTSKYKNGVKSSHYLVDIFTKKVVKITK